MGPQDSTFPESPSLSNTAVGSGTGSGGLTSMVPYDTSILPLLSYDIKPSIPPDILFKALKLSIPLLAAFPLTPDGRPWLSKALSVGLLLADLQMDAQVISAGILRPVVEAGSFSLLDVRNQIGPGTAHLLNESLRVTNAPSKVRLTYHEYDTRAMILDLVLRLDMMRHFDDHLLRYQQQVMSLDVMTMHAPLAHAVGIKWLSLELEDLSCHYLFPQSYTYVATWLTSHEHGSKHLLDMHKEEPLQSLKADPLLASLVPGVSIDSRFKSRYSTMKKLLKDGRKLEQVNDVLGLRVILEPKSAQDMELGEQACYRAREVVRSLWKEVPHRRKDYIARPYPNGYWSLHMAVDVRDHGKSRPLTEIQIRTKEMDPGTTSYSLYTSCLTDAEEMKKPKTIMISAAELAALRFKDLPSWNHEGIESEQSQSSDEFDLFEKQVKNDAFPNGIR